MSQFCASLTQGIQAFNVSDLIPNGYINEVDVDRSGKSIRLKPANRLTVELQYSVRAAAGTTLNDIAGGAGAGGLLGGLAGGSGFLIGQAIGITLQGDFEPTRSQFVFHVCEAKTYINKEIILTQEQIDNGVIELPQYVMGVMSVTRAPLELTDEQIEFLGRSGDPQRGSNPDINGLVATEIAVSDNLFVEIIRDERKLLYRADNNDGINCFINNSHDDLVDKKIRFTSQFEEQDGVPVAEPFEAGDSIYITYEGAVGRIVRHAIFASSFFFLFPGPLVQRIGQDRVRSWNFEPFVFRSHKNALEGSRVTIVNMRSDDTIDNDIDNQLQNPDLTQQQRNDLETERNRRKVLSEIEGQRVTEAFWDNTVTEPYIRGFYIADIRGIFKITKDTQYQSELLISASEIRDQLWWTSFIENFIANNTGHIDGQFDFSNKESLITVLQKGFLFDISSHVNSCIYDNEKYGYQRDLALALMEISPFNENEEGSGLGISNFDLEINQVAGKEFYDASSSKFSVTKMSSTLGGSYFIRDCNTIFNPDNIFFQGASALQADMFIRTPVFFEHLSKDARIYMERFSPQLALAPDGGIWVVTNPFSTGNMSIDIHPNKKNAALVFADSNNDGSLQYHFLDDGIFQAQYPGLKEDVNKTHQRIPVQEIVPSDLRGVGYDKILGNEPGYSAGLEVTTEMGKAQKGLLSFNDLYQTVDFSFQTNENDITVNGINDKLLKEIKIEYRVTDIPDIDVDLSLVFVFPNKEKIIDNVVLSFFDQSDSAQILSVKCPFYSDSQFIIRGEVLNYIEVSKITGTFINQDVYNSSRISTSNISTVFDAAGNWYIFYEDEQSFTSSDTQNPLGQDNNGLQNVAFTEISCLVSYDQGLAWFDHKGVVRTAGDETIGNPYCVMDRINDLIHLFFVINDSLFHKILRPKDFDLVDAFKGYRRPQRIDDNTPDYFGLEAFSDKGKSLRLAESSLVVGNIQNEYLLAQIGISENRINKGLVPRFGNRCQQININEFSVDFIQSSYCAYLDRQGTLSVLYFSGSKLYIKTSYDRGITWQFLLVDGVDFHKHDIEAEPKQVDQIGALYNQSENSLSIIYQVDGMMFFRTINSKDLFDVSVLTDVLLSNKSQSRPIFVVGALNNEFKDAINDENNRLAMFPYTPDQLDIFDEDMSIQSASSKGYIGAGGYSRFFYKDANGDIRAFTMQSMNPVLDTRLTNE